VIAGSLDSVDTLKQALNGAESIFWCIPQSRPGNLWDDAHEYHNRFASAAAEALRGTGTRVIAASAGRNGYEDHGIVSAFSAVEATINATGAPVRHLRSAFFMENLLESLPTILTPGAIFYNGPGDLPLPMVCVADVAVKAVALLVDRSWTGQGHIAVHGPADVSFDEMAGVLSDVLGKTVRYVQVPDDVLIENLVRAGLPLGFAQAYARLLTKEALMAYGLEPRSAETTTTTTLREWASNTLLPAFRELEKRM
jgi:uncharacterized protein YbjT (DUF2867 family)